MSGRATRKLCTRAAPGYVPNGAAAMMSSVREPVEEPTDSRAAARSRIELAGRAEQRPAGGREHHPVGRPVEQVGPEVALQRLDRL